MSAAVHIDLREVAGMAQGLDALLARSRDLSPLMDAIGGAFVTSTEERFAGEHDPRGIPWKQSIRARETGTKTLTDRGHLVNSITHNPDSTSVEIGSNLIYAAPNFFGATIRGNPRLKFRLPGGLGFRSVAQVVLPARNPLGIGGDDEQTAAELTGDYILAELGDG